MTPVGSTHVLNDPTLHQVTGNGDICPWQPDTTPEMASSSKERLKRPGSANDEAKRTKKSCHSLNLRDINIVNIHNDSGSDGDNDKAEDGEQENNVVEFVESRRNTRRLRDYIVEQNEGSENVVREEDIEYVQEIEIEDESVMDERIDRVKVHSKNNVNWRGRCASRKGGAGKAQKSTPVNANFSWFEDFSSFKGHKESYSRVPGSTFTTLDPAEIFHKIWDHEFMEMVVRETNKYAWDIITQKFDPNLGTGIPEHLKSWTDVTVEELYRYFIILILLSLCQRPKIHDYWSTGLLGMTEFRSVMPRNRFFLINNFLHFVTNIDLVMGGDDRKIEKVAPVLEHCNRKFAGMYTPSQHLCLDESLLLGNRLNWKQCIRSKGASSLELCEAETGYLLQYRLYTIKRVKMHPEPLHGFQDQTSKVVLDLLDGYLDVGHVLVIDNWYNQLPLTRYLKTRRTDVLGTINRRRQGLPPAIRNLIPNDVDRGTSVSRHSGDIALVAFKDAKLVTIISTYHQHEMLLERRVGQEILKPEVVQEHNQYMRGVDFKDQKLSVFLDRQRNLKWYMKVFRRLLSTSLLNAFIIYTRNPTYRGYSHRDFGLRVAEGLLRVYPPVSSVPSRLPDTSQMLSLRLQPGNHFPVLTEVVPGPGKKKRRQLRCVRCSALKRRVVVTIRCDLCRVPLCFGACWKEYHSVVNLNEVVEVDGGKLDKT